MTRRFYNFVRSSANRGLRVRSKTDLLGSQHDPLEQPFMRESASRIEDSKWTFAT